MQAVEAFEVRAFEVQCAHLEEVETLAAQGLAVRIAEGILYGESHVRHAQLRLDAAIAKLDGTVDDALRMHVDIYL